VLAACGSLHVPRHRAAPVATARVATGHTARYCEPNGAWDGWNCGRQPGPVPPQPVPVRPAATSAQQLPAIYADVPPVDTAARAAPAPADPSAYDPGGEPAWRRLAYRAAAATPMQQLPAEFYAVQIAAMSSFAALEAFRHAHGLDGVLGARIESGGHIYYALLLGVYRNLADARAAAAARPASLAHYTPWFRKLDSLKAAVARADALAGAAAR
jgi:septal ring-binding cell division protein DamX